MAPGNDREPQIAKVELDRKLDNPKSTLAERCGAVAGYAILLQGKSSASVCNSAFLKLADIFEKTPDNMLRFAVVNVMGRCHTQLMRVFNTDILVHKVHTVLEKSIDPIARSLALRALACMAELLIHNQRIHSDVRNALRSPNEIEQTACILCVQRLSQLSQAFASGAVSLIGGLVIALETPLQQRLHLISVLQHMDRDPRTVLQSRQILHELMHRYPVALIATVCIRTLSSLTIRSRMGIDEQKELLLSNIQHECRSQVRLEGARSLASLLRRAPSCVSNALANRLLALARQSSERHDERGAAATLGTVMNLARTNSLADTLISREMVQGFKDLYAAPHAPGTRKLSATAFALLLYTCVRSGAFPTGGGGGGGGGGGDMVDTLVVDVTEVASQLISETETLAQCDIDLMDALLPLIALLLQPGPGGGGRGVLTAGRKLLQGCRLALVRTWDNRDPHGLLVVVVERLNAACILLDPDALLETHKVVANIARDQRARTRGSCAGDVTERKAKSVALISSLLLLGAGTKLDQAETVRGVRDWCFECLDDDAWIGD